MAKQTHSSVAAKKVRRDEDRRRQKEISTQGSRGVACDGTMQTAIRRMGKRPR